MRPFLVAGLLLLSAVAVAPAASADGIGCVGPTPKACVDDQGCVATVYTTGAFVCLVYVDGSFDPTHAYLVVCAVDGAVHVCVTDDSESTVCVHVETQTVCPFDIF